MYISNSYAPAHKTGDRDMQWIFLSLCLPFVPSTLPSLPKDYGIAVAIPMTMLGAFKLLDSIIIIAYCFTRCLYLCSHSLTRTLCCFCFSFRCVFGLFFIDFDVCYLKSSTSTVLHTKISSRVRAREYQRFHISLLGKLVDSNKNRKDELFLLCSGLLPIVMCTLW